jgi:hypothetical protein
MDEVPRIFTLEEANELVPTLELEFGRMARLRAEVAPLIESIGGPEVSVEILQHGGKPAPGHEAAAERLKRLAGEIAATVERVNSLGCLVKDLEMGLVDFFSMQGNEPIFLCWQFGEPAVAHWHPLDEGFAGRRPIEGIEVEPPEFIN